MKGFNKILAKDDSEDVSIESLKRICFNTATGGFMKSVIKCLSLVLLLSCLICASVASAGVPYVFSPETTAESSQVNDNFNFVNYGNIVVKANGVEIGTFLGRNGIGIALLTPQGYMVAVTSQGGVTSIGDYLPEVVYTTGNCTGTPYSDPSLFNGQVFPNTVSGETIFYVSKTAVIANISVQSVLDSNGTCVTVSTSGSYLPVTPNDPSVTGVSSANLTPPITIERR